MICTLTLEINVNLSQMLKLMLIFCIIVKNSTILFNFQTVFSNTLPIKKYNITEVYKYYQTQLNNDVLQHTVHSNANRYFVTRTNLPEDGIFSGFTTQ